MNNRIRNIAAGAALAAVCILAGLMLPAQPVWAASSAVTFGSTSYTATKGTQFRVGVYIRSDETPGTYHAELRYDAARLKYISGADQEKDGTIILEGTATGQEVKYMIYFEPISGGNSGIVVSSAEVCGKDGTTMFEISNMARSPITISGTDSSGSGDYDFAIPSDDEKEEAVRKHDVPVIGVAVNGDGEDLYLVDLAAYQEEGHDLPYQTMEGEYAGKEVLFITDEDENVRLMYLMDETGKMELYACGDDEIFYQCGIEGKDCYISSYAVLNWPSGLTDSMIKERQVVYRIQEDAKGAFLRTDGEELLAWDEEVKEPEAEVPVSTETETEDNSETGENTVTEDSEAENTEEVLPQQPAEETESKEMNLSTIIYGIAAGVILLIALLIIIPLVRHIRKKKKAKNYLASLPPESPWAEVEEEAKRIEEAEKKEGLRKPVKTRSGRRDKDAEIAEQMQISADPEELMPAEEVILTGIASEVADMKATMDENKERESRKEKESRKESRNDEVKEPAQAVAAEEVLVDFVEDPEFDFEDNLFDEENGDDFLAAFEQSLENALKDLD